MDHAPAQAHIAVVQHGALARCHSPLLFTEVKRQASWVIGQQHGAVQAGRIGLSVTRFGGIGTRRWGLTRAPTHIDRLQLG
jgi:hypothetical protein